MNILYIKHNQHHLEYPVGYMELSKVALAYVWQSTAALDFAYNLCSVAFNIVFDMGMRQEPRGTIA